MRKKPFNKFWGSNSNQYVIKKKKKKKTWYNVVVVPIDIYWPKLILNVVHHFKIDSIFYVLYSFFYLEKAPLNLIIVGSPAFCLNAQ